MDSYFFATDGSVDEEVGRGGYASVTPHTIDGWSPHPSGKYSSRSKGVACYGAEAIAVDTCELMAVVDVLENGPQANLTLLVDASYIMFGFNAHPSGIRRQVRRTNRALWLRANSALNQRIEQGFFVRFRKCSSHNQDSNQHQLVTLWNDRADTEAKAGCRSKTDLIKEWVPDGDFSFQLLARGKLVRGDPRSHIGRAAAANAFTHAETLKDGGILPALISEVPCGISLGTLYRTRSAVQLARAGVLELQSFAFCLQNFALRTPSREYLSKEVDWTKLRSHLPRENKKCICPLCGDAKPDTWHYSTQCSFTDNLRAETQAATGALLTGICSLGVHDPNFPNILAAWFQHNFMDITGPDAVEICNATAGSGSPANALHWDGTVDWPLMLCSTKTLSNFLKLPGRPESTVLLIVPAGRFPKGVSSLPADAKPTDIPQTLFEEEEVCLVLLRNTRLAPVPGEGALAELSAIMSRFILFGAWGLSLHWGNERFSLDNKDSDEGADLLAETGLLQSAPDKPHRKWHHSHTWLGILPAKFDGRVGKALMLLSPTARQKAKDTIALTILAGQHKSWLATESMITRYLKRQKVIQRATNLQRPAPIFRRLYPSLGPSRAIFPPSTRIAEKAAEYLRTGGPMDRAGFLLCAAKLGLGSRELPSVWLAVHILGVNSTADELAAARGPDPVPAPDYGIGVPHNGSSFLTPGNHERLLQAEARTRTALNNSTTETKVSGFERCKAIMIRRLRMGHTPQEQREEQRQSNVESTIPPNERDKVALSSGPEAPAPHAALPDTSLSTKRAEGPPIRTEATLTGSLNHLASGGARIYTTPDLPVDLTEEEEPMAVADIPDEILAGIISGLPGPPGHLLRPISISERQLAQLIWSSPGVHGQERAMEHISNTHWYSGTTMDTLATKLSQWVFKHHRFYQMAVSGTGHTKRSLGRSHLCME